jgi:hypothetical protein
MQALVFAACLAALLGFPTHVSAQQRAYKRTCEELCKMRQQGEPKRIPRCMYRCEMVRAGMIPRRR